MGQTFFGDKRVKTVAIILARGGSKGIPNKNIIDFCGKPLIAWTIGHCIDGGLEDVYVSSDSDKILSIANEFGAKALKRPDRISGDTATSESGWLHAMDIIEVKVGKIDWVLAPQVTSPLRTAEDINRGIDIAYSEHYDSLFSCSVAEDLFFWEKRSGKIESANYDWRNRIRRQKFPKQYIENGSFYIFRPDVLRDKNNRFGKQIGIVKMKFWKMFEIDSMEDLRMCAALMEEFIIRG
jgi:N-acylneuraminate cytidylyltransferase